MESRNVAAFDPTDLANAVDENLYDLFRAMAQGLAGGELDERDGHSHQPLSMAERQRSDDLIDHLPMQCYNPT